MFKRNKKKENRKEYKKMKKIYGPFLTHIKWNCHHNNFNSENTTEETYAALDGLFEKLSILKNMTDEKGDTNYFLDIRLPRGEAEDEMSFEDAKEYYEIKTKKQYYANFKKEWREKWYWFELFFFRRYTDNKTYYLIYLNNRQMISIVKNGDPRMDKVSAYPMDYTELVNYFSLAIDETLEMIKNGTYKAFMEKNFPYYRRQGIIKLKDYWKLYPKVEQYHKSLYKDIDVDDFINTVSNNFSEKSATRFDSFTAKQYYDLCQIVFEAAGKKIDKEKTSKQNFYDFADGRTQGLKDIDENSPEEFEKWYKETEGFFDHTFEIFRGRSFYRGDLYIEKTQNGKYFLQFNATDFFTQIDIIKGFMALKKLGIICYMYYAELYVNRIKGESMLVLNSEDRDNYGYSYAFGESYYDAIHINKRNYKKLIPVAKWEELEIEELKEK